MEHWQIYAAAIGTVLAVWGVSVSMAKECKKQIHNVYRRFDEYKDYMGRTHVSEKVCDILHKQLNADVAEIKKDVKELLKKANGK